jgi:NDP-sugar pyrophosphorylase family protein
MPGGEGRMQMLVLAAGDGWRLRSATGGGPKQLVDVAGRTLLDRQLDLARGLELAPLVVTRPVHAARFAAAGVQVLTVGETPEMLATLYGARRRVEGDFVWVGGDMLFTDLEPLRALLAEHLAERACASFVYRRSDRHLAKLTLALASPRVEMTRDGEFPYSLPALGIQCAASLAELAIAPRRGYVQRLIDRGERVLFREYRAPVFEVDTPEELAAASRYFARCSTC